MKADYDDVADQYNRTFSDIKVRRSEVRWLCRQLPAYGMQLLEIGCGNGSLLKLLSPRVSHAIGVDVSTRLLALAEDNNRENRQIEFKEITGSRLPAEEGSCDVVISMLSWRYLCWKDIFQEILRVLKPGGRLLVVDMTSHKASFFEYPRILMEKLQLSIFNSGNRIFRKNLQQLVRSSAWKSMVCRNPIRDYDEYIQFFDTALPGAYRRILNRTPKSRILAINSGPLMAFSGISTAVIDWGIGGLGVYNLLKNDYPGHRFCYFSDSGFTPYGTCSASQLEERLQGLLHFLYSRGVGQIIIACNAMSTALDSPKLTLPADLRITGVIKPAVQYLKKSAFRHIGVIGGDRTIHSGAYTELSESHKITQKSAQPLSALIERGMKDRVELELKMEEILMPMSDCDSLVLGCTHYPAALPLFQKILPGVLFLDPAEITCSSLGRDWAFQDTPGELPDIVMTTGDASQMRAAGADVFGTRLSDIYRLSRNLNLEDLSAG